MSPFILYHFSNRSIFQNFPNVIVLSVILVRCPPTGRRASWLLILKSMLVAICLMHVFCCVISLQSAELQKKLHHLEVQLKNEKQHMGDLEHKYRYCANTT